MTKHYFNYTFIILVSAVIVGFTSCHNNAGENQTGVTQSGAKYEIMRTVASDTATDLYVYVEDSAKLTDVNTQLVTQYNPNKSNTVTIMYFDSRKMAERFYRKVTENPNQKEEKLKKFMRRRIGIYKADGKTHTEEFTRENL